MTLCTEKGELLKSATCYRAAAYDGRIKRLVMYDLIYDFYGSLISRMGKGKAGKES